ncbi:response regulator transcription factor [Citroniella saccharovorans]|uniref:Response regulator transcription factor n=1 Tax=Citroniella saccharovorans TaxID=2053367 RepID=A0AAW9MMI8_9FIRM|nr:response regulator transcription factor [Citroniella saccharovorans]
MIRIILVEDELAIRKALEIKLENLYDFKTYSSFEEAKDLNLRDIDLVLLDISLKDGSGLDLYKIYKMQKDIRVIFLTANDEEETIVKAFDMGADDYLTKPFKMGELLARIKKLFPKVIKFKSIVIDTDKKEVYKAGEKIKLSPREYDLFLYFVENKNIVIERQSLFKLWEEDDIFINDNTLSVNVKRLREKLNLSSLRTVKNVGYVLDEKS